MNKQPAKLYGLIGYPLGHSFSQDYFNKMFESEGIDAGYLNFELPDIGDLMEAIAQYPNLCGLNVTIPYKEQVIPYMDEMDSVAAEIGAVNVIKFYGSGTNLRLKGYNSDVIGFTDSIAPFINDKRKKSARSRNRRRGKGCVLRAQTARLRGAERFSHQPSRCHILWRDYSRDSCRPQSHCEHYTSGHVPACGFLPGHSL